MRWFILLLGAVVACGCTHAVHVNHTSDFQFQKPLDSYVVIEASSEQDTILGWVGEAEYVDEAFTKLQAQCEGGEITGIQTRYSTSHGFFSWTNKIVMKGYCSR